MISSLRRAPLDGLVLLGLLATGWGVVGTPPAVVCMLAMITALVLPGAALLRALRLQLAQDHAAAIILALGPVLFGGMFCVERLIGVPLHVAAFLPIVASAALWWAFPSNDALPRPRISLAWILGATVLLVAIVPLLHDPMRLRDDARLHLPVIQRLLAGEFPPGNPFLAGEPLAYFWFYHAVLAGTSRLAPLPLDWLPSWLNLQAMLALLLATHATARALTGNARAAAYAVALVALGLTPWGWARLLELQLTRPDLNWALIDASGASGLFPIFSPQDPRLASFLTKIAVSNALPMSLALGAIALHPDRPSAALRGWVPRTLAVAGALAFHIAAGGLLVAGLAVRWLLLPKGKAAVASAISMAAGCLLVTPYLLSVLSVRSGGGAATFLFQPGKALALHGALAGLLVLTVLSMLRTNNRRTLLTSLAAGLPAAILPFGVHLIDGNEYKGTLFLVVVLAPLAGAGLAQLTDRARWAAPLILLLFLPTPILASRAYFRESPPGILAASERADIMRLARGLPEEGVVWRPDPGRGYTTLTYPLGRANFLSDPYALQILGQWESPEARLRRGSLEAAVTGNLGEVLALAASKTRTGTLLVALSPEDRRRFPRLETAVLGLGGSLILDHPKVRVLRLQATRQPAPKP